MTVTEERVELLILILAMFIRALFLQPKSSLAAQQGINQIVNRLIKEDNNRLVALFVVFLLVGYLILALFGSYLVFLLETALFIYLFLILHDDIDSHTATGTISRDYLEEKLNSYLENHLEEKQNNNLESHGGAVDKSHPTYEELAARLYSLWLYDFFTATLVLVFWYVTTGWLGLLVYSFVYYLRPNISPNWLVLLKRFLEIPAGIIGSFSCAIAGRMDAVIAALFSWKFNQLDNGRHLFEASVSASVDIDYTEALFYKRFNSVRNLCLRSLYVWLFVMALILIV